MQTTSFLLDAHDRRDPRPAAALVVNGASRRGRESLEAIRQILIDAGLPPSVHVAAIGAEVPAALAEAMGTRPRLLVVGGGDGTLAGAADLVAGTDTVLGALPLGTANDFARTLGLPQEPVAALAAALHGKVVDVDLGRADGRPFLNVASLGLSVAVAQTLTPGLKRRLGRLAYPVATARAYRAHRPFGALLEFPDGDREPLELTDLLQLSIGNGRHFGGGNTVAATASIDDHLLDVHAIGGSRLRDHVSIAKLLKDGSLVDHDGVHHVTTRRVLVTTDRPMPVNLDGEVGDVTPTLFEVERNAVHVAVPADSDAARLDGPGTTTG